MPNEKFIMTRKIAKGAQTKAKWPMIRVHQVAYKLLHEIATETGLPVVEIATKAIQYAYKNLEYCDPDESSETESDYEGCWL